MSTSLRKPESSTERLQEHKLYIGGQWIDAMGGETIPAVNPATGKPVATLAKGTRADVGKAVEAARAAQPKFARWTPFERTALCHKIADAIESRRDDLARRLSAEQGKPYHAEAFGEIDTTIKMWRMSAEDNTRLCGSTIPSEDPRKRIFTIRQPRGTYAVVTPWNFPVAIPTEYLSAAVATGNAVVWVPALTTASVGALLMECMIEGGLPEGVVNFVTGEGAEVGDEAVGHPGVDAVGFTGSSGIGAMVAKRAAGKPQLLELGGNAPTIIMPDADLEWAAECVGVKAFLNCGQICNSIERVLVHKSLHKPFMDRVLKVAEGFKLGDPMAEGTTLGPIHTARQAANFERHIEDAKKRGAKILRGGVAESGFATKQFFQATIVDDVPFDSLFNTEETFAPVLPVAQFSDEDEALRWAANSTTGLAASVFTRDIGRALRMAEAIPAGVIDINEGTAYWQCHTPFGGYSGKASGMGKIGGRYTLEEMTQLKLIFVDIGERK